MPLSRGRVLAPPAVDPAGATALASAPSAGRPTASPTVAPLAPSAARPPAGPTAAPLAPSAGRRVLPEALVRARAEAEAIVEAARAEAAAIVAEARQQAASARADAEREGRAAGEAALAAGWLRLRSAEAEALRAREGQALAVARLLAERLLGRALALEPALMADLARAALATVVRARRVVLRAHPADADSLRRHLHELGLDAAAIEVHDDPERPRGGLRAETDLGTLDADLAPQLDRLVDALRRA